MSMGYSDPTRTSEWVESAHQRVHAFIAAQGEHDRLLERIGPLDAPYPLPRCSSCGSFGARDPWGGCPECTSAPT